VLDAIPKGTSLFVFTNPRTHNCYSVSGVAHVFRRAVERAGILTGDITLPTLRQPALIQMIAAGYDDYTVMAISGHSSTGCWHATRIRPSSGRSARSARSRHRWAACGQNGNLPGGK
jgi:hypothetical protein